VDVASNFHNFHNCLVGSLLAFLAFLSLLTLFCFWVQHRCHGRHVIISITFHLKIAICYNCHGEIFIQELRLRCLQTLAAVVMYISKYMHTIVFGLVAPRAREKLYMHALYVSALRPWEYADTSTSHKLGSEAYSYNDTCILQLIQFVCNVI